MSSIPYVRKHERWEQAALRFSETHIGACCCGGHGYVRVPAPVGHILFGKGIPCVCQRDEQKRIRAHSLRRASGISDNELSQWRFETFKPEFARIPRGANSQTVIADLRGIKQACEQYAERPHGWLLLRGDVGTGKTHLAYAIAGACMARDVGVFAHTVPDLLELLRESYGANTHAETLETLKNVELLVLDDLGAQRDTGWAMDTLYQIVNHRYAKGLPMVVTTNCDLQKAGLDHRLVSRLLDGSEVAGGFCRALTLGCADFRPTRMRGAA